MNDEYLTPEDIAVTLKRPVRWVRETLLVKQIPALRIGKCYRVSIHEWEMWVSKNTVSARIDKEAMRRAVQNLKSKK